MSRQENELRKQFEDSAQIMLQEQAKRERTAYNEELHKLQAQSKNESKQLAHEAVIAKNKNDKLNREVLDKEQLVLDLQNKLTLQEADCKHMKEQLGLAEAKVRAMEAFSSDLQQKYDKLELRCR